MGRYQYQILVFPVQSFIGHQLFKFFFIGKEGIVYTVVKRKLLSILLFSEDMNTVNIVVHTLKILQKSLHIPLSVRLHGFRFVLLTCEDLTEMIEGQITVCTVSHTQIIEIGHLRYGIITVQYCLHARQYIFRCLLILYTQRLCIIPDHFVGNKSRKYHHWQKSHYDHCQRKFTI